MHASNRVHRSVEANGPIKRINIYLESGPVASVYGLQRRLCSLNTIYAPVFRHRRAFFPLPYVKERSNYIICPSSFLSFFLCFFTTLDTEQPPFFRNIVTAFRGTATTLSPALFFPSPPPTTRRVCSFSSLCPFSFRSLSLSVRRRFSPSFSPAAHHVLQYRRAASGVTPVIRDGPDEAFIILSEREGSPFPSDSTPL